MDHARHFIFYFLSFQIIQISQQINLKKCPSSIRCWDLNPQPIEHKSSPITPRPGLPPQLTQFLIPDCGHYQKYNQASLVPHGSFEDRLSQHHFGRFNVLE